jgi:hypothetical protein
MRESPGTLQNREAPPRLAESESGLCGVFVRSTPPPIFGIKRPKISQADSEHSHISG